MGLHLQPVLPQSAVKYEITDYEHGLVVKAYEEVFNRRREYLDEQYPKGTLGTLLGHRRTLDSIQSSVIAACEVLGPVSVQLLTDVVFDLEDINDKRKRKIAERCSSLRWHLPGITDRGFIGVGRIDNAFFRAKDASQGISSQGTQSTLFEGFPQVEFVVQNGLRQSSYYTRLDVGIMVFNNL